MNINTLETMTELVKHEVINASTHAIVQVVTRDEGIDCLRENLAKGESSRLVSYRGFYVRNLVAVMPNGDWKYSYRLVWREW